jgi:hypothetical protein
LHQDHVRDRAERAIRDRLETERANLVIGLFVARVAAMRLSSGEQAADVSVNPNLPIARRG